MRGSASVEMLLILIVSVYLAAIVYKEVIASGFQFTEDEYKVSMARLAADKIANISQTLRVSAPGTVKKAELVLPEDVSLRCIEDQKYIEIEVNTARKYDVAEICSEKTCKGQIDLGLDCNTSWKVDGPIKKVVALVKIGGNQIKIGDPA